jgi:tetratricopeptide (TPR) repeat protein
MLKKILILIVILVIIAAATIPMWTTIIADKAFEKPTLKDSPEMAEKAIRLKMYFYLYNDALKIAEKAIVYFPESTHFPSYIYSAAICAEKTNNIDAAIHWYGYFVEKFPQHTWTQQAQNNYNKLKALHKE